MILAVVSWKASVCSSSPSPSSCSVPSIPLNPRKGNGHHRKKAGNQNTTSSQTQNQHQRLASSHPVLHPTSQLENRPLIKNATRTKKKSRHHQPSTNPPSTARRLTPDTSHVIAQPGPREWNVGATHTTTPHHTAPHHRTTRPHQPTSFQKHPDRLLVDNQTYTPHGAISLSMHACPCEKDSQPTTLRAAGFLFRTTPWLRRRHTCLAGGWMMGMEVGEPRWGSVIIFREPRDRI